MNINPLKILKHRKQEKRRQERQSEQQRVMKDVFHDNFTVLNGPFQGMKYIPDSYGSALLPKLIGSYEEPIQAWIDTLIDQKKYQLILDIGCAEGYYACGFAYSLPDVEIRAYDVSPTAHTMVKQLAEMNQLKNISIHGLCSHEELNRYTNQQTLVFCDIEGAENELLMPEQVPNLKYADLIIESHDCIIPGITEKLISRFKPTHHIKLVIDYPNRVNEYKIPVTPTAEELKFIFDERRAKYMRFLYLQSKDFQTCS
ncbi:hypothetical protein VA7868_02593 [Vibrio aerogenes CECT 7868]|uniref:Uncharacterized protein n=1 Tax=Vibrio aerogenes CECT 7868 TaxID=1216006 RepID=A0A1M5ZDM1_9VIBR|nr:methyltransferase [Vibrio aerogenes]SHI22259.1 hypothetical protein VA7868_02593 [Vibrio aerogenes CECT 7868]